VPALQDLAYQLATEAHRLAINLRPTALEDIGLVLALEQLLTSWSRQTGIPVIFHSEGLEQGRLPREVEVALYRVVQEALTNVQKHAEATNVSVVLERHGRQVSAIVEDNGRGYEGDEAPTKSEHVHLGVVGMRERLAQVGGRLEIESSPGSGTTVFARIPLDTHDITS
jgi:signal transduction histidine kinase